MQELPNKIARKLDKRQKENALRSLGNYSYTYDFATNDYLGVLHNGLLEASTTHTNTKHQGGASGSRLLTGNHQAYNALEAQLATIHKVESALVFNSGYAANLGLISAVPQKGDLILYDKLVHASIRDGIALSQAKAYNFEHNNLDELAKMLERHSAHFDHVYVITESVFSMDGDSPALKELSDLCQINNCYLIVDEAHAVGVFGEHGTGLVQSLGLEKSVFARIITFGKALGGHGAAVLCKEDLKQYLVNFARSLIYTTAMPPSLVTRISESYQWMQDNVEYQLSKQKLYRNIAILQSCIVKYNLSKQFVPSNSAVHCCVIPGNKRVKDYSKRLQHLGFGVLPILAPTVPKGQERIRICLHAHNTEDEIRALIKHIDSFIN